jgi:hypothetical protein
MTRFLSSFTMLIAARLGAILLKVQFPEAELQDRVI